MARSVEGQVARYSTDVDSCKTGLSSLFELIKGRVGSVHIGKGVFVVGESHYLLRKRRFERVVLVVQVWWCVSFAWHKTRARWNPSHRTMAQFLPTHFAGPPPGG